MVLALALVWMLGTWLIGAPAILLLGPLGYGVANLVVQLSAFWVVRLARERVALAVLPQICPELGLRAADRCGDRAGRAAVAAGFAAPPRLPRRRGARAVRARAGRGPAARGAADVGGAAGRGMSGAASATDHRGAR